MVFIDFKIWIEMRENYDLFVDFNASFGVIGITSDLEYDSDRKICEISVIRIVYEVCSESTRLHFSTRLEM